MIGNQDTICALATPNGIGAIGVIRLSGADAWSITSKLFSKDLKDKQSHTVHFGTITSPKGELLDEVLVTLFSVGKSYTGEESVEISCHGSSFILLSLIHI